MKSTQGLRLRILAQHDGHHKHGDYSRSPSSPTVEHLRGDASRTPYATPQQDHDTEDDHTPHKKSVLSKVKEKARKLRNSLSGKRRHGEGENTTPSWGVKLEDCEDKEEDMEYLGAPLYESDLVPDGYKENARLHPKSIPVIPEKQVPSNSNEENEKPPSPNKSINEEENENPPNSPTRSKAITETVTENPTSPNKTLAETVTEKLAPAYATVSDATNTIATKIQDLTLSTLSGPEIENHAITESNKLDNLATFKQSPEIDTKTNPEAEKQERPTGQIWDKGVSVKEYIMNKLEPGEEERALSKVITDAMMSPRRSPREGSVVGKMKEAVTSLIWHEESPKSSMTQSPINAPIDTSTSIPVSTNPHEVFEEFEDANEGRVLQTN